MSDLTYRSDEAVKGGFQSILKIEATLSSIEKVEGKPEYGRDQVKVITDDTIILEMEEGEPEPDLEDGQFTFYMNFAKFGKTKPNVNSFYAKAFCASAEALCKERSIADGDVRNLIGTRVVLERKTVPLFKQRDEAGEVQDVTGTNFVFVSGGGGRVASAEDHVRKIIVGLNKPNALRKLMQDSRTKSDPAWREKLSKGTLEPELGLVVNDNGLYEETANVKEEAGGEAPVPSSDSQVG